MLPGGWETAPAGSLAHRWGHKEAGTQVSNSNSLCLTMQKLNQERSCHRERFKTRKRKDLSIQICKEIVDLLATGHHVGKENKGIQDGISPTSEMMVCTQSRKSEQAVTPQ